MADTTDIGEGTRAQLRSEFADQCRQTLDTLTAVMRNESDHILLHTLQSMKCELEWAADEFGRRRPTDVTVDTTDERMTNHDNQHQHEP